jgi:hypothetical protein
VDLFHITTSSLVNVLYNKILKIKKSTGLNGGYEWLKGIIGGGISVGGEFSYFIALGC